jgi:hypothetical protein
MNAVAVLALALVLAGCMQASTPSHPAGPAATADGLSSTSMVPGDEPSRPLYNGTLSADLYRIYLFQRTAPVNASAEFVAEDRMYGNVTVAGGHVELRLGQASSAQGSTDAYPVVLSCTRWWDPNFAVDLPTASFGQCQAPYEPGTYHLRAHAWAEQSGGRMDWWSQETALTVD